MFFSARSSLVFSDVVLFVRAFFTWEKFAVYRGKFNLDLFNVRYRCVCVEWKNIVRYFVISVPACSFE